MIKKLHHNNLIFLNKELTTLIENRNLTKHICIQFTKLFFLLNICFFIKYILN